MTFIASILTAFIILAVGSEYDLLAIAVACIAPAATIVAFLVTPMAPPQDPDEPPPLTLTSISPCIAASYALIHALIRGCVACMLAPLTLAVGWLSAQLSAFGISLEKTVAVFAQLSMGATASMQIWRLLIQPPTNVFIRTSTCISLLVALPDSVFWLVANQRTIAAMIRWLNAKKIQIEELSVSTMQKEFASVLFDHGHGPPCTHSSVSHSTSRAARYVKLYARQLFMKMDDIGYLSRQSPLKVLVVILDLMVASAAFSMPTMSALPNMPRNVQWATELGFLRSEWQGVWNGEEGTG